MEHRPAGARRPRRQRDPRPRAPEPAPDAVGDGHERDPEQRGGQAQGELAQFVEGEDVPEEEAQSQSSTTEVEVSEADLQEGTAKPSVADGKLIAAEARAEGRVSWRTYATYIRAAGISSWFLTVFLQLLIRFVTIGNQVSRLFVSRLVASNVVRCVFRSSSLPSGAKRTSIRNKVSLT